MLRVAVPNKGVLSEPAAEMLAECGYRQRRTTKALAVYDPDSDTEFFYLRPRDIAVYVAAGTLDVGITGRDMLLETAPPDGEGPAAVEVMTLGFGRSSFRFAGPMESGLDTVEQLAGKRIATAYPGLLQRFLDDAGLKASVVRLDGAVETACRLGVADAVCDVVETGTTLRAAGLRIIGDPVLSSEAILVRREGAEEIPAVAQLRRRLAQDPLVGHGYAQHGTSSSGQQRRPALLQGPAASLRAVGAGGSLFRGERRRPRGTALAPALAPAPGTAAG